MDKEYLMNRVLDHCYKDGNKVVMTIEDFFDILENDDFIRNHIYRSIERDYHKQDILDKVEEYNQSYRDDCEDLGLTPDINEMYLITPKEIEMMTDEYEEILEDNSSWAEIVDNVIERLGKKGEHQ